MSIYSTRAKSDKNKKKLLKRLQLDERNVVQYNIKLLLNILY